MSTILYDDDKFLRIYETLTCKRQEYACLFNYPEGWQTSMNPTYKSFVDDLRVANLKAYNERYDDGDEPEYSFLDFTKGALPYTDMEFYVALNSISYNIDDENVNDCALRLVRLIASVAYTIISRLPQYDKHVERVW